MKFLNKIYFISLISFVSLLFVFPISAFAITFTPNTWVEGGTSVITNCVDPHEYLVIVNDVVQGGNVCPDFSIGDFFVGTNTIIEFQNGNYVCNSVATCILDPNYIMTTTVNVTAPPSGEDVPIARRYNNYYPEVSILSPKKGQLFSDSLVINYKATDQNNIGSDVEKEGMGFRAKPVSLFYSDKISEWYNVLLYDRDKILIAKDLSAIGQYKWSVKDLVPGVLYRIIVDAIDAADQIGEGVSDFFSVDFTPPVYNVTINPPVMRGGEVTISVDASEDLLGPPEVQVTQNENIASRVTMTGEKSHYEGIYTVITGFDGPAFITVSGFDLAGNLSTNIVSGGTFSIGVNPPPKPQITSSNKSVVKEEFINIEGTVRKDTEAILKVNGEKISIIKPDSKGKFTFTKVKLEKVKNQGKNYISVTSLDATGNISESALVEIKYNIPPTVSILKPLVDDLMRNKDLIEVKGVDQNQDVLLYTYQNISESDYTGGDSDPWENIVDAYTSSTYSWDTTEVDDGEYMLRVIADDGNTKVASAPVRVIVKNVSPFIRFENGRKTVTNKSEVIIVGKASSSLNLSPRPNIEKVEYSMDRGKKLTTVDITGLWNADKKFSVTFSGLKEGVYPIVWRIKDSRNLIGRSLHTIIVDQTKPKAPEITSPRNIYEVNFSDESDENMKMKGVQISVSGTTESTSLVTLIYNNQTLTTRSFPTGTFTFSNITLDKKGKYELKVFATDDAGNVGASSVISSTYNNPPVITFINPKPFRGLSGKATIAWDVKDADGDEIENVTVSYRKSGGIFKNLLTDTKEKTYILDTSNLPESNDYELRISASDGLTPIITTEGFFIDKTIPEVTSFILRQNKFSKTNKDTGFNGFGNASDATAGVEFVEYAIKSKDILSPWYKGIITKGFLGRQASYAISYPKTLGDGSYNILVRVVDAAGNVSLESMQTLSIDKTPPHVGSFFISKNNIKLTPDQDGNLSFYKNDVFIFSISLENNTNQATVFMGNESFVLKQNITSGLWETPLLLKTDSVLNLSITVEDNAQNILVKKSIGNISGVSRGSVSFINEHGVATMISGARINVLKLNEETGQYSIFAFGISAEIKTDETGIYDLVLPNGKYRLVAISSGFKNIEKKIVLDRAGPVSVSFVTKKLSYFGKIFNFIF